MTRIACLVLVFSVSAAAAAAQDGAPARGEKVFAAQKCALCHVIGDAASKKVALDDVGGKLSADEMRSWITNAPAMAVPAGGRGRIRAFRQPIARKLR